MKKINLIILMFLLSVSCAQENLSDKYAESITSIELSDLLYEFASDENKDGIMSSAFKAI